VQMNETGQGSRGTKNCEGNSAIRPCRSPSLPRRVSRLKRASGQQIKAGSNAAF
jgi:hypothetical protein